MSRGLGDVYKRQVIYDKYAGIQIKDGDTEYLIVKNEEIVALIKK